MEESDVVESPGHNGTADRGLTRIVLQRGLKVRRLNIADAGILDSPGWAVRIFRICSDTRVQGSLVSVHAGIVRAHDYRVSEPDQQQPG